MRNPLRGIFKPTPEDNAALDVVREAMEDVRKSKGELPYDGGWVRPSWDALSYYVTDQRNGFRLAVFIYDGVELAERPGLEIHGKPIPLSLSARRELRRMVKEFRVKLAMQRAEYREEV